MTYIKAIFIAIDQFLNTLFSWRPDVTLSSRCWRWDRDGVRHWPRKLIDIIFFWEKDHCLENKCLPN